MDKYAKLVGKEVKIIIKANYLDNCNIVFVILGCHVFRILIDDRE